MKKIIRLLLLAFLPLLLLSQPLISFATEPDESLIHELTYNKETQMLSGKTVPDANITLADVVGNIVADNDGNFSMPIPAGLEKSTVTIMDFINDQSANVVFDFVAGKIEEPPVDAVLATSQTSSIGESPATSSSSPQPAKSKEAVSNTKSTKPSQTILWALGLVCLIIGTVITLFLITAKKQQAKHVQKRRRSKHRKKRHSRHRQKNKVKLKRGP